MHGKKFEGSREQNEDILRLQTGSFIPRISHPREKPSYFLLLWKVETSAT